MADKEFKANMLHDAYVDLKSASGNLGRVAHDESVKPLLNEAIALMNKLQKAYEQAYDEADNIK